MISIDIREWISVNGAGKSISQVHSTSVAKLAKKMMVKATWPRL